MKGNKSFAHIGGTNSNPKAVDVPGRALCPDKNEPRLPTQCSELSSNLNLHSKGSNRTSLPMNKPRNTFSLASALLSLPFGTKRGVYFPLKRDG